MSIPKGVIRRQNMEDGSGIGLNYLLIIAINEYVYAPKLSNCIRDAEDLIDILTSKYDFEAKKQNQQLIFKLFNEKATRKNILKALNNFKNLLKPTDNLLIYFSGHGEVMGDTGFWIPVDAHPNEDDEFISTYDITQRLNDVKSLHTFLIVDACFSGSLFSTHKSIKKGYEYNPSRWGLAASHSKEVALDGQPGENSPFANRLLTLLKNNQTSIGIQQLCSEVIDEVQRITNNRQTPVFQPLNIKGHELGQFVFHLKKDELTDWAFALKQDSLKSFGQYLLAYPNGKYKENAKEKINLLNADLLWGKILNASDNNATEINSKTKLIDEFITKYRNSENYQLALEEGKKLSWKRKFLKASFTKYALIEFLDKHPPFFKEEADRLLVKMNLEEQQTNTPPSSEVPKSNYKRTEYINQEKKQKFDIRINENEKIKDNSKKIPSGKEQNTRTSNNESYKKIGIGLGLIVLLLIGFFGINSFFNKGQDNNDNIQVEAAILPDLDAAGNYGYKQNQKWVITPQFTKAENFISDRARVSRDRESYYINIKGECVTECPQLYRYIENGKFGVRNQKQKLTTNKYEEVGFYGGGFIAVSKNKKWGFVDLNGKEIIPIKYDKVNYKEGFTGDKSLVTLNGKEFYIDKKGKPIIEFKPIKIERKWGTDVLYLTVTGGKGPYDIYFGKSGKNGQFISKGLKEGKTLTINIEPKYRLDYGEYFIESIDSRKEKRRILVPIDKKDFDIVTALEGNWIDEKLSASQFINTNQLIATIANCKVGCSSEVLGFELVYLPKRADPVSSVNTSAKFNEKTKRLIKAARPGSRYFFRNIKAKLGGKTVNSNSIFVFIDSESGASKRPELIGNSKIVEIKLGKNYESGSIGNGTFKAQSGLSAFMSSCKGNCTCKITSYTLTKLAKRQDPVPSINKGQSYSEKTKRLIRTAKPGDLYYFNDIKVSCGSNRNLVAKPLVFWIK